MTVHPAHPCRAQVWGEACTARRDRAACSIALASPYYFWDPAGSGIFAYVDCVHSGGDVGIGDEAVHTNVSCDTTRCNVMSLKHVFAHLFFLHSLLAKNNLPLWAFSVYASHGFHVCDLAMDPPFCFVFRNSQCSRDALSCSQTKQIILPEETTRLLEILCKILVLDDVSLDFQCWMGQFQERNATSTCIA